MQFKRTPCRAPTLDSVSWCRPGSLQLREEWDLSEEKLFDLTPGGRTSGSGLSRWTNTWANVGWKETKNTIYYIHTLKTQPCPFFVIG